MAYSDFTLRMVVDRFGLTLQPRADLFADLDPVPPSDLLRIILERWAPQAIEVNTEKARSELIISPILMEASELARGRFSVFSGVSLDVDRDQGLFGRCDFLLGRKAGPFLLGTPFMAVVEAKNDDIPGNLGQCVAAMVAAARANERDGHALPLIHGCVTTGDQWLFLQLRGASVTFDIEDRTLADVERIVAYLVGINPEPGPPGGP